MSTILIHLITKFGSLDYIYWLTCADLCFSGVLHQIENLTAQDYYKTVDVNLENTSTSATSTSNNKIIDLGVNNAGTSDGASGTSGTSGSGAGGSGMSTSSPSTSSSSPSTSKSSSHKSLNQSDNDVNVTESSRKKSLVWSYILKVAIHF